MCFAPQRCAFFPHRNVQKWREHVVLCAFSLRNVLRATTACTFSTSQLPKVVRTPSVLYILTWTCASRHNSVHFFDISTSKSGPRMVCFVHFDLEMRFAPQRRALFRHLNCQKWSAPLVLCTFWLEMCFGPQRRALFRHRNFQKWSENGVFCTFWLRHVLRATTACNFSSLIWPAGSAPAALASLLFNPPEPQSLEKHSVSWLSYLFSHLHLLSSYSFSSTLLSSNLSLLSASSLLCFSSVHIVGSLTSKLPPNIPLVPHKAVAEVAMIGNYRRGELLWCMDGKANPLMDRKVVGVVFFGVVPMVAVAASPATAGCGVVCVVWWSCSCIVWCGVA